MVCTELKSSICGLRIIWSWSNRFKWRTWSNKHWYKDFVLLISCIIGSSGQLAGQFCWRSCLETSLDEKVSTNPSPDNEKPEQCYFLGEWHIFMAIIPYTSIYEKKKKELVCMGWRQRNTMTWKSTKARVNKWYPVHGVHVSVWIRDDIPPICSLQTKLKLLLAFQGFQEVISWVRRCSFSRRYADQEIGTDSLILDCRIKHILATHLYVTFQEHSVSHWSECDRLDFKHTQTESHEEITAILSATICTYLYLSGP